MLSIKSKCLEPDRRNSCGEVGSMSWLCLYRSEKVDSYIYTLGVNMMAASGIYTGTNIFSSLEHCMVNVMLKNSPTENSFIG